jgi:hypothetical protein
LIYQAFIIEYLIKQINGKYIRTTLIPFHSLKPLKQRREPRPQKEKKELKKRLSISDLPLPELENQLRTFLEFATSWPPSTTPSSTLLISQEEKPIQELPVE